MPTILALADARRALGLSTDDLTEDTDLSSTYLPAVDPVIEDLVGPVITAGGRLVTADGGRATVLLPSPVVSVESVTEDGTVLTAGSDYTVNEAVGVVSRGTGSADTTFSDGLQNVVVSYTAGPYATQGAVPANIKLAARIVLAHLWQNEQGGYRPEFGSPDNDLVMTPSGFAVPRRAVELLSGQRLDLGFA